MIEKKNVWLVLICAMMMGIVACQKEDDSENPSADREKFLGTWKVSANGSVSKTQHWDMVIRAGASSPEQILIDNFDQNNATTIGSVEGNSFVIAQQLVGGDNIQGSGSYSGGKLTFTYTTDDGIEIDNVTATAQR